jgi:Flp pilus assembly protein CpaB
MIYTRRYLALAGVSALVAAFLFFMFLQRLNARAAAAIAERQEALVLVRQAEPGQTVTQDMFVVRKLAPADIPDNAIVDPVDAVGKTASVRLYPGEVLLADRLGDVSRLSAAGAVPRDHVAFALSIKPHTGVAALIAPGDRVDVIGYTSEDEQIARETESEVPIKVILTDIRVVGEAGKAPLAEERPSGLPTPTPIPPNAARVLILDVTPEQAVTLADAVENGNVYVALRSSRR